MDRPHDKMTARQINTHKHKNAITWLQEES